MNKAYVQHHIHSIDMKICPPNLCSDQNYNNDEGVVHYIFACDNDDRASDATPEMIHEYVEYCRQQIQRAEAYLLSQSGESAAEWLKAISGMFGKDDSKVKTLAVYQWMKRRVLKAVEDKHDDLIKFGEVNLTMLTEDAVYDSGYFPKSIDQDRILYDETHWLHDVAVEIDNWYNQEKGNA